MTDFDLFLSSLKAGNKSYLPSLTGSALSFVLAGTIKRSKQNILIITPEPKEALDLYNDLHFFSGGQFDPLFFPALDVQPYFSLSPNPDVIMDRVKVLWQCQNRNPDRKPLAIVTHLSALERKTVPSGFFGESVISLQKLESCDREKLSQNLTLLGYQRVPLVEDRGTFSVRGGIVDIFSPAHDEPLRMELFGDQIESLRFFNPDTQKSSKETEQGLVIPAREILFKYLPKNWSTLLKQKADETETPKPLRDQISQFLDSNVYFNGIETFIPFFYEKPSTLFDFLPSDTCVFIDSPFLLNDKWKTSITQAIAHREQASSPEKIFSPDEIYISPETLDEMTEYFPVIEGAQSESKSVYQVAIEDNLLLKNRMKELKVSDEALQFIASTIDEKRRQGTSVFIVSQSLSQQERLKDILLRKEVPLEATSSLFERDTKISQLFENDSQPHALVQLVLGPVSNGFYFPDKKAWILTDEEIFGQKSKRKSVSKQQQIDTFTSFADMAVGDFVVHQDHGIGLYKGLVQLTFNSITNDYILLEYLGGDKLYVPVDQLNRLSRFSAQEGMIPVLDKMGGTSWKKVREKVKKATRKLASELLQLQAVRASLKGFPFSPKNELFEEFEATFPFDETDDQLRAIDDVLAGMESDKPMDRLVCGDVGYGKTEVAIRASFKAVLDNKQVGVLVPTTILAFQHYETFKKRFSKTAVKMALISRFQTAAEQKEILKKLKMGEIDVVIGTHRLLSKDVVFRDVGLLVIDEEHRFGVDQKEKIKKLKKLVDVLTLTATPIPRTLNFALVGIRDLSLINTPPVDRLAIRTYLTHFDEATLKEAVHREVKRGGQVFFVHNRVQTIGGIYDRLKAMFPELKIKIGHGQMPEEELEDVMISFMEHKCDILLCTTIVESGLDIPNANTIIINRADQMGLAQLYQLRGRVGRSHHRAYCYLLIPHDTIISDIARKRLNVIQKFTELGSGFKIASHDLEIRGAGNILGPEQSGHIGAVGYDLYVKLLEEAVNDLKGERGESFEIETELRLPVHASIPNEMVPDTQLRLNLYKEVSSLKTMAECEDLKDSWIDRFGELPLSVTNLIKLIMVRVLANVVKISQVSLMGEWLVVQVHSSSPISTDYWMALIKNQPRRHRFMSDGKFGFLLSDPKRPELKFVEDKILDRAIEILSELQKMA